MIGRYPPARIEQLELCPPGRGGPPKVRRFVSPALPLTPGRLDFVLDVAGFPQPRHIARLVEQG